MAKKSIKKSSKKTSNHVAKKLPKASVKYKTNPQKISKEIAVVALILNIIILPGLGTLIGGKTKNGIWQIVLFLVGILLSIIIIGIPIAIGAWIWGIFSGVKLIEESK